MPKSFKRTDRIAGVIKKELSHLIQMYPFEQSGDPLPIVTLTTVEVSRNCSHAKVYITFLEDDAARIAAAVNSLKLAAPQLRKNLSTRVKLRSTPELQFIYDKAYVKKARLLRLIDSLAISEPAIDDSKEPQE